jgi:hypothetical protein
MRNLIRFSIGALAIAAAGACAAPSAQPALSDDLKADLAKVGGGDVQLAGAPSPRLDVVSATERTDRNVPTPHAPAVSRVASANRGTRAVVHNARHVDPAPASVATAAEEVAPSEAPRAEPAPEPTRAQQRPQAAPTPTQREPRGGWKSEAEVFRNAPFPINP